MEESNKFKNFDQSDNKVNKAISVNTLIITNYKYSANTKHSANTLTIKADTLITLLTLKLLSRQSIHFVINFITLLITLPTP